MAGDPVVSKSDSSTSTGNASSSSVVTLEQYFVMTDKQKEALPLSRRKKLEKQLVAQRRKEAKVAVTTGKQASKKDCSNATNTSEKKKRKSEAQAAADLAPFVNNTPPGEKKILSEKMAPTYQPRAVEAAWYEWWEAKGFFHADVANARDKTSDGRFVMVIPPPNVTGSLHLGHALMCAVQDALARYHRMCGKEVLWVPGVDHAGIATQVVVEKQLSKRKGTSRHTLGREAFVSEVWKWKEEYGGKIVHQIRRIGSSCDWQREEFTMSKKLSTAVHEAFIRLYDQGLIYRDIRLVNWSSALHTAISEIEVDSIEIEAFTKRKVPGHIDEIEFGVLTKFAYKVDGTGEELIVATTRLETMLGDTGVAVHPDDNRYKHLIGRFLTHPFVARKLPIIGDGELVDMSFGTGVVKVTPAHDPNDFACGRRNNLPEVTIFDKDGNINRNGGERFNGMKRYVARVEVERALDEMGLLRGKEPNAMSLPVCSRSGDVVEPMLLPQWWVNCKELAKQAVNAVRENELEIVPEQFKDTWYRWLENIHDWCISRQLWWGHRIPAYEIKVDGNSDLSPFWVVGRNAEEARSRAAEKLGIEGSQITLEQDEDVLDTWFSSGLFPFSVFGWPESTEDLNAFYPTSVLETGHDILFFWVARMVMMGLGLTGKLPFKTVLLHSLVRDKRGRKMSKSLGNVIDPLEVINGAELNDLEMKIRSSNLPGPEVQRALADQRQDYPEGIPECGADALRIGLLAYMTQGGDINLDVARVIGYRNFCNKLWNATRFALTNLGTNFVYSSDDLGDAINQGEVLNLWILSRLNATAKEINGSFDGFHLGEVVSTAYRFWMNELCSVFLEGLKPVMRGNDDKKKAAARACLYECLSAGLRILHPMMPFVTEELYQRLPGPKIPQTICLAGYPTYDAKREFNDAERSMEAVMAIVQAIRALKAEYGLKPSAIPEVTTVAADGQAEALVIAKYVETLVPCGTVNVCINKRAKVPNGAAAKVVDDRYEVHMVVSGLVDVSGEIAKLEASAEQKRILIADYDKKMAVDGYESRVPAKVRERNLAARKKYLAECANLEQLVQRFRQLLRSEV